MQENNLSDQYILTDYDGEYQVVGPFESVREAKSFASGIEHAGNDDMRVLGIFTHDQLLVDAKIEAPKYLTIKK